MLRVLGRARSRGRRPTQAGSVVRGKLGEGVEWQSALCRSQTGRSVLLPGRAETFPRMCPGAKTGSRALGAIVAGGLWRGSTHQGEGGYWPGGSLL